MSSIVPCCVLLLALFTGVVLDDIVLDDIGGCQISQQEQNRQSAAGMTSYDAASWMIGGIAGANRPGTKEAYRSDIGPSSSALRAVP